MYRRGLGEDTHLGILNAGSDTASNRLAKVAARVQADKTPPSDGVKSHDDSETCRILGWGVDGGGRRCRSPSRSQCCR